MQQAVNLFEKLKQKVQQNTNAKDVDADFLQLKLLLTQLNFLQLNNDPKQLLLAQLAAQWSIQQKRMQEFERYCQQLHFYYFDLPTSVLPASQRQNLLHALYLLLLLSQNRIAEFHLFLEKLDPEVLNNDIYVKFAVQLEQRWMEGCYHHVWKCKQQGKVPAQEFLLFMDLLMDTIRQEVASCAEKAYQSLPIQSAIHMFYLKDVQELSQLAQQRGWTVLANDKQIHFGQGDNVKEKVRTEDLMKQFFQYGHALEKII